jgi:putative tricarboxylic transport membrane protein
MRATLRSGEIWLSLGLIALGVFLLYQTSQIDVAVTYARVGPRVFPWMISGVLVLLGILLLRDGLTGRWVKDDSEAEVLPPPDRKSLQWLGLGLLLYLAAVTYGGFAIASGLLFAFVARAFGSRRIAIDLALGLVIGIVIYIGFHHGLGLTLPGGILEPLLG